MIEKWNIKNGTLKYWKNFFNFLKASKIIKNFLVEEDIIYEVTTKYDKKIRILCLYEYIFTEHTLYEIPSNINLVSIGAIAFISNKSILNLAQNRNLGITREKYLKEVLSSLIPIKKANELTLEEILKDEK